MNKIQYKLVLSKEIKVLEDELETKQILLKTIINEEKLQKENKELQERIVTLTEENLL